jgi:large subunit ribosomal protein L31
MKKDIHPNYQPVVFEDTTSGFRLFTKSTLTSDEMTKWEDGKEYPRIVVEVSSASHPFYTGKQMLVDTAKRVDKFQARVAAAKEVSKTRKGKKAKRVAAEAKKEEATEKEATK